MWTGWPEKHKITQGNLYSNLPEQLQFVHPLLNKKYISQKEGERKTREEKSLQDKKQSDVMEEWSVFVSPQIHSCTTARCDIFFIFCIHYFSLVSFWPGLKSLLKKMIFTVWCSLHHVSQWGFGVQPDIVSFACRPTCLLLFDSNIFLPVAVL